MSVRCLLGHVDRIISAQPYMDTSWGERSPMTATTVQCCRCGRVKYDQLVNGHRTLAELVGES